jgi:pimeloyl-ACP methyl ester carboxylesterase
MELLEGESLRSLLSSGPLPVRRALDYAAQAAEGLIAAHAKGIVHRDLKPENLWVTKDRRVKVLDFGLAKLSRVSNGGLTGETAATVGATQAGAILGTYGYMAPEQVRGQTVDERADVFALGVVLFEMLTGRRPFVGATALDEMHAVLHDEAPEVTSLRSVAPPAVDRIVRRCLAKDPERRFQTVKDVRNEVEELKRELELGPSSTAASSEPRRTPLERMMTLTAAHVRELSVRNPRLVGYPMTYLDNRVESDRLVVMLHGVGADDGRFEPIVRLSSFRTMAPTLVGFGRRESNRPSLGMDDHSRLLRLLLREMVREAQPKHVILVGHSAGADQLLRMIHDPQGPGVEVAGLVALGANVSRDTCFASTLYAGIDIGNPGGTLEILKTLGRDIHSLSTWLVIQSYLSQTFIKFGSDLEPLKRYAADLVAPFQGDGDPLADWYRSARQHIPRVRLVFSNEEATAAEALLARHLEHNVLGDQFTEDSFVIEPVDHMALLDPALITRHLEAVMTNLPPEKRSSRDR